MIIALLLMSFVSIAMQSADKDKKGVESVECRIRKIVTTTATATALKGLLLIDRCCSIGLWTVIVNDVHLRLIVCVWIFVIILSLSFDGSFCSATIVVVAIAVVAFVSCVTVVTNRKIAMPYTQLP